MANRIIRYQNDYGTQVIEVPQEKVDAAVRELETCSNVFNIEVMGGE